MRAGEKAMTRRRKSAGATDADAVRSARAAAKAAVARRGLTYRAAQALSAAMKLDVLMFGRVRSGPFFALLRKTR